jgi:alpha-1,2-mannosyltransferase
VLAIVTLYALANTSNALHKGGDFDVFVDAGRAVRSAVPLYQDSAPGHGIIGPPFQGVFFVPAAWLADWSPAGAKLAWHAVGVLALAGGIWCWAVALPWPRDRAASFVPPLAVATLAIVLPAQTNFEHQNLNTVLLVLTGGAALALRGGRDGAGGALVGSAVALKAFPAALLFYLACRRRWRAFGVGLVTVVLLTALPAIWYGPAGARTLVTDWLRLNEAGGWPVRAQNQSLFAMWTRLTDENGYVLFVASACALIGGLGWLALRGASLPRASIASELALALGVAVLISPIAWDHYWVLLFPAFLVVARQNTRVDWMIFGAAAILVSGFAPLFGSPVFNAARAWSSSTIAAALLTGRLAVLLFDTKSGLR